MNYFFNMSQFHLTHFILVLDLYSVCSNTCSSMAKINFLGYFQTDCVCNLTTIFTACVFVSGLLKTHNLSYQDCENLQAVFDKESCANVLRAQPRSAHYSLFILQCYIPPSLLAHRMSVSVALFTPCFMCLTTGL